MNFTNMSARNQSRPRFSGPKRVVRALENRLDAPIVQIDDIAHDPSLLAGVFQIGGRPDSVFAGECSAPAIDVGREHEAAHPGQLVEYFCAAAAPRVFVDRTDIVRLDRLDEPAAIVDSNSLRTIIACVDEDALAELIPDEAERV